MARTVPAPDLNACAALSIALALPVLDCPLKGLETCGTILHERIKENCQHFLHAAFTQICPEALDVYTGGCAGND